MSAQHKRPGATAKRERRQRAIKQITRQRDGFRGAIGPSPSLDAMRVLAQMEAHLANTEARLA